MPEVEVKSAKTIKFNVDIGNQVEDGLFTGQDLISFCKEKIKVRNSSKMAQRKIIYEDNYNSVTLETDAGNLVKRNMKLYIKRFLRTKALKDFVRVRGIPEGFKLEYVNKIDEDEASNDQ